MVETSEARLKRLTMRSWRRGMREMDLVLGPFADAELAGLPAATLDAYETLLAMQLSAWDDRRVCFVYNPMRDSVALCVRVALGGGDDSTQLAALLGAATQQVRLWRQEELAGKVIARRAQGQSAFNG